MIKLLCLQPTLPIGGAERVLFDIVTHIDRTRFLPTVVCCYDLGPIGERLGQHGVPVYHNLFRSRLDLQGLWRLIALCRRERFDVLYTNEHPLTMLWGGIVSRVTGIRATVMAFQSTGDYAQYKRIMLHRLVPFDEYVALSQSHRRYLSQVEGLPEKRIRVIHNGVDPEPYIVDVMRSWPPGVPHDTPLVGIIAMLRPEKAHDVFLRAAAAIYDRTEAHFLIVGEGPTRPGLERLVSDLGIGQRVHFLGKRDDIPQILAVLDLIVLSSRPVVETFPIAVLEAMAAAKPVVCTQVGSIADLVIDQETGILVPPDDPVRLGQSMLFLLNHPEVAKRMGVAGRMRLLENFTLERMVRGTEDMLDKLLVRKTHH